MRLTLIINTFHFQSFGVKRREKKIERGNTLRLVGGAHNWFEELKIGSETKYPQTVKLTRLFENKVIFIFVRW